ncbi:MAG: hypothetical protein ACRDHP_08790, partial [Ktedonobacterales bacterium]
RLAILFAGALTLVAYVVNPIAARAPWPSSRYLLGLLITFPAVLAPLWSMRDRVSMRLRSRTWSWAGMKRASPIFQWALVLFIVMVFVRGAIGVVGGAAALHAAPDQRQALIASLERAGITHIYTDYWNCDSIAFQSGERITCAVLDDTLAPGYNRYEPYVAAVQSDHCAAYILPAGSPMAAAFVHQPTSHAVVSFHSTLDGYEVYSPCRAIMR